MIPELIQVTDKIEFSECPICRANAYQMFSILDPNRTKFGIEQPNFIHQERELNVTKLE